MSDEQLDQNEIERLLGGGGDKTPPPAPEPPAESDDQQIDQSAIEALMAGVQGGNTPEPSAPEAAAGAGADESPLQQNEIEALLAGTGDGPANDGGAVDNSPLQQDEIEALLGGGGGKPAKPPRPARPSAPTGSKPTPTMTQQRPSTSPAAANVPAHGYSPPPVSLGSDVNVLLEQAERAIASIDAPTAGSPDALPFKLADFSGSQPSGDRTSLNLLRDVELELKIELGRTRMPLEEMMKLKSGSVVALDKLAGDPVDIYVNGRMIARGEVLVFNDNFCVRVAELITGDKV